MPVVKTFTGARDTYAFIPHGEPELAPKMQSCARIDWAAHSGSPSARGRPPFPIHKHQQ
jgi:hypothetical protein